MTNTNIEITRYRGQIWPGLLKAVFVALDDVSTATLATGIFWFSDEDLVTGTKLSIQAVGFAGPSSSAGIRANISIGRRGFETVLMQAKLHIVRPVEP